ncbi:NfeD family protein [Cohnella yongneupensis]|uniref:NfeD family protein n=1 Tax=Cohnella yongneupensis TaxID=425006 RepID=A0ABW0R320_9BACL
MDWWAIWLIVGGVLIILEMLTLTFYLLWLGIGAVVAAVVALLPAAPDNFVLQALSGGLVALLLTVYTKPLTRKFRQSQGFKDAIDDMVGKPGIVLEDIVDGAPGIVKVGSETWSAISKHMLHKEEKVRVISRGTTVLEVQKWED